MYCDKNKKMSILQSYVYKCKSAYWEDAQIWKFEMSRVWKSMQKFKRNYSSFMENTSQVLEKFSV